MSFFQSVWGFLTGKKNTFDPRVESVPSISFPSEQQVDEFGILFPALVDGRRVVCRLTYEQLQDEFGKDSDIIKIFLANRSAIESRAATIISQQRDVKGPILLK